MKRTDLGGGAHRARGVRSGVLGALLVALLAAPVLADAADDPPAEPDDTTSDDSANDDTANDDTANDDTANDDEADEPSADDEPADSDEDAGEAEETIRTLASNRHMLVEARSLRLTERAADRLLEVARVFHRDTGRKLVVTGGERNAERQAQLMYKKLDNGEDLLKLYARDDLVRPIVAAYEHGKEERRSKKRTLREMTDIIQTQVTQKQYVSRHLAFTAADVRSRDMTPKAVGAFKQAVKSVPGVVLIDERKSAAPCFHLSM